MSDVDYAQHEKQEPIGEHRVEWEDVRVRQTRVQWIERLAYVIGRAHFSRFLVYPRSSNITFIGREADAKIAGYLLVVLVRTLEQLSHDAAYRGGNKGERGYGYRQAFIDGFVKRLAERFEEERRAAQASSSTTLVRLQHALVRVDEHMKMYSKKASSLQGRETKNQEAYDDGRAAANKVQLRANALEHDGQSVTKAIGGGR